MNTQNAKNNRKADFSFLLTSSQIIALAALKDATIRPNNSLAMPELSFKKVPGQRQLEVTFGETMRVVNLPQNGKRGDHVRLDVFMEEHRTRIVPFEAVSSTHPLVKILGETTIPQNKLKSYEEFFLKKEIGEKFRPSDQNWSKRKFNIIGDHTVQTVELITGSEIFICYNKPNPDNPEEVFVTRIFAKQYVSKAAIEWFRETMQKFAYVDTDAFDYLLKPKAKEVNKAVCPAVMANAAETVKQKTAVKQTTRKNGEVNAEVQKVAAAPQKSTPTTKAKKPPIAVAQKHDLKTVRVRKTSNNPKGDHLKYKPFAGLAGLLQKD